MDGSSNAQDVFRWCLYFYIKCGKQKKHIYKIELDAREWELTLCMNVTP